MKEEIVVDPALSVRPSTPRRISWQAIFGGLIMAMSVQLLLTVLAISIKTTVVNSMQQNRGDGIDVAIAIGWIVISIISLFVGGWVAGRMSGFGRSTEGALHGLVTWGAATLVVAWLLSSNVGDKLWGTGKLLSQVLPTASLMMASNSDALAGAGFTTQKSAVSGWDSIRQEAEGIARRNGTTPTGRTPDVQPGQNPGSTQLVLALNRMFKQNENISPNDREAVVNILVTQDNMNRADASQTVDRWVQAFQQSKVQPKPSANEPEQSASQNITLAQWWCFIALALGAIAAGVGGSRGALSFLSTRVEVAVAT